MEKHICQSCGMPIKTPEMYGTGTDGLRIEEYCIYCYEKGGFTSDVTMEEMMNLCAKYVNINSRDYYLANMRTLYPHLKRWAKKENTHSEYYKSVSRVIDYINKNLHENTNLVTLAGIAHISPYHFHRIFKSVIGESMAGYVNRLRMEYVAGQLKTSGLSLAHLALQTGYSSEQALSRAFKKYFNLPPKVFKAAFFQETFNELLVPRICKISAKNVIILCEQLPGSKGWQKLYTYAMVNRVLSEATESLEIIREAVYCPALTTKELVKPDRHVESLTLPDGLYAIFTHKGEIGRIPELYVAIHNFWLPASKYQQPGKVAYVVYLNNPAMVPAHELLAEIYIYLTDK